MDADLAQMVKAEVRATRDTAAQAVESWVTSADGLGVFFTRRAYTLYGLAQRSRSQDPYVRSGELRRHVQSPRRVQTVGEEPFRVVWWADARLLNFMKGKMAIYREQWESVSRTEMDGVERRIQTAINKVP
jgi:hypothetical protein